MTEERSFETGRDPTAVPFGEGRIGDSSDVFAAAARLSAVPLVITDPRQPDNPIVFANPAFQAMTGYAAGEIRGRNCRFLQGPDTDPATVRDLRTATAAGRAFSGELLNYRKDGSAFWNALSIAPISDASGTLSHFVGSLVDATPRRDAEDALRQMRDGDTLRRAPGSFAHDFNNLLQVIIGYLELIKAGLGKPEIDMERLTRGVGNARAAADRATTLTQQFLALSRAKRLAEAVGTPPEDVAPHR